jgi:hypothetical protein
MNPNPALIVLLISAIVAAGQPKQPRLLEQAIRHFSGVRLLDPSVDLVGAYTVEELKESGYWPPWVIRDLDRDGRPDVAPVVVKPGPTPQFGVVAVHARTPATLHWVVPLDAHVINGLAKGTGRDTVTPLFCVECDGNSWFRWSGRSYEAELYAVGEQLLSADDTTYRKNQALGLFAKPSRDSSFFFRSSTARRRSSGRWPALRKTVGAL